MHPPSFFSEGLRVATGNATVKSGIRKAMGEGQVVMPRKIVGPPAKMEVARRAPVRRAPCGLTFGRRVRQDTGVDAVR